MLTQPEMMSSVDELEKIARAAQRAEVKAAAAKMARDEAVRAALSQGRSVADIVSVTGLSRERVYQIRDRRR